MLVKSSSQVNRNLSTCTVSGVQVRQRLVTRMADASLVGIACPVVATKFGLTITHDLSSWRK